MWCVQFDYSFTKIIFFRHSSTLNSTLLNAHGISFRPVQHCRSIFLNRALGTTIVKLSLLWTTLIFSILYKYCISRNFRGKIFMRIWLGHTFRKFLFSRLSKYLKLSKRELKTCIEYMKTLRVSLPLSPNNHYRHTSSMKSLLEMALRPISLILQVGNKHTVLHH